MPPRRPPSPRPSGGRPAKPGPGAAKPKPAAKPVRRAVPRPAAARPATTRPRTGSSASRPTSTRPRAAASGRAAASATLKAGAGRPVWVLGAVAVLLAVLILPYVQKWLVQRSEIAEARAEVASARREVAQLEAEQRRWQDPDYVKAQARERLHYVMPGETGFVVVDGTPQRPVDPADPSSAAAARVPTDDRPWFGDLWDSVQVAGDPKTP